MFIASVETPLANYEPSERTVQDVLEPIGQLLQHILTKTTGTGVAHLGMWISLVCRDFLFPFYPRALYPMEGNSGLSRH
jgi:hypothetical protein